MIKDGHKMARPFNIKKMASYFKEEEVVVYETDEYLLIADRFSLFRVDLDEKIAIVYKPEQKYRNYKLVGGQFLEYSLKDIQEFWQRHIDRADAYILSPTSYFYQHTESMFLRKFTNSGYIAWIQKSLTDLLGPLAIDLDYHFHFEQLYDHRDPKNKLPIRVSFRKTLDEPWKVVAFFATWSHAEEEMLRQ